MSPSQPVPSPPEPVLSLSKPALSPSKGGRRLLWFALFAVLLFGAALLLTATEEDPTPTRRESIAFPRHPREHEQKRLRARATLVVPPAPDAPEDAGPQKRDPFLVALPAGPDDPVIVLEANALRHSRLGELFVDCAIARNPQTFEEIQRDTGIDVLTDVDRVAFAGEALVMSGYFDRARWDQVEAAPGVQASRYGDGGRLYTTREGQVIGAIGDGLIVFGDEASVRRAIDQVEGRAPPPASAIPDDLAYGEIYGVMPGSAAGRLAGKDDRLAAQIAAVAQRVELHVDAMDDVAAVVRVRGDDAQGLTDLSKSLGAALTAARLEASALDDRRMTELLDFAKVSPGDGSFSLELALPADRLEAWFSECAPPPGRASAPEGGAEPPPDGVTN
jgi:hypothetical protein